MITKKWKALMQGQAKILMPVRVLAYLIPLIVIISIWVPELNHYYVPSVSLETATIERAKQEPSDEVFQELNKLEFITPTVRSRAEQLSAAEDLLRAGRIQLPGNTAVQVHLPFRTEDLEIGLPSWQLRFASLEVSGILLDAYRLTGKEVFFDMARRDILAWAEYEQKAWLPRGFLWNDHAVAARIPILARFWREYRRHPGFDLEEARLILGFVARSGEMLVKPSTFTFATNHGVMQNLALWHLALAFPILPEVERFKRDAEQRFALQMDYYIDREGVILEHSAGYHGCGMELVGMALRYMSLLDRPIPPTWLAKYEQAKIFYAQLRRPDGSLPLFGDTDGVPNSNGPLIAVMNDKEHAIDMQTRKDWRPLNARSLNPVAGYAVWWTGLNRWPAERGLSQTVVTWSNFPGHGHKLDDELSVLFWADGQTWWTNVGYWPYGVAGRDKTMSWGGSNAPHAIGEHGKSERVVQLHRVGWNDDLAAVDLERVGPDGYRVRRQVFDIQGRIGIAIDNAYDPGGRRTQSVWRTYPGVRVFRGKTPGAYQLVAGNRNASLSAFFIGQDSVDVDEHVGDQDAFSGWVALGHTPTPASALVVSYPSQNSWNAVIWSQGAENSQWRIVQKPIMRSWQDPTDWELEIPTAAGMLRLKRQAAEIHVDSPAKINRSLQLRNAEDVAQDRDRIQQAFAAAGVTYEKYPELGSYRLKATYFLLIIFIAQAVFFMLVRRYAARFYPALTAMSIVGWVSVGLWLSMVYFKNT